MVLDNFPRLLRMQVYVRVQMQLHQNKKFYLTKHVGGKPLIVLKAYGLIPDCTKDGKVGIIGFHFLTCGDRSQPFLCGT